MILGQRIRLDLNNVQRTYFERCAGAARFVFNTGLARWQELYKTGEKPNWRALNAEINARKRIDLDWLRALPWAVPNNALRDLDNAFSHFFRRVKAGKKPGYPHFKSKKRSGSSFAIENRAVQFDGKYVKLPKLGWVHARQELRFPGKILSVRFTKRAGHWYVSIRVEVDESRWSYPHRCETQAAVGVDLGLVDLAVLSTGERIKAPRVLRRYEKKLRRLNKELSRRTKGGKNREKTQVKLSRLHERITNVRRDVTNKLTASLVRRFARIGVENLNISGMARGHLAKSVMDASLYEVRRQLEYKSLLAGSAVVKADRFYPSSKRCSSCGDIYADLTLSERRWTCDVCGAEHDRDDNAAKNLKTLAEAYSVAACCPGSADVNHAVDVKLLVEQESSSVVDLG